ncbi:MAG: hypothetical protein JST42_29605 [Bacteroidetes bacterium]|nr:hypothetical protein [Bacteroidota bacterium]
MTSFSLLPLGLVLHISGIVVMVGSLFAGYLTNLQLWKCLPYDRDRALTIVRATAPLRMAGGVGGIVIVAGGILMMTAVHGAFMHQVWFKVKMGILAVLIVNMIVLERPAGRRLRRMLYDGQAPVDHMAMSATRARIRFFYLLQLGLFLLIFVVSAYKFN